MFGIQRVSLGVTERKRFTTWNEPGRALASPLDDSFSPAVVLGTVKGLPIPDFYAKFLRDRERNLNPFLSRKRYSKPQVRVKELDLHSNSSDFAQSIYDTFQDLFPEMKSAR